MKKVIRRRGVTEYLRADGTWTKTIAEAWSIGSVQQAISAVSQGSLEAVELVYMAGETPSGLDVAIPLERAKAGSDRLES